MRIIKRYPNRKLYDTEAKTYIALDKIADLIRSDQKIQVIDNQTGEDITALTLTQIILKLEKGRGGSLPLPVLASLIQTSSEHISALQRNLLMLSSSMRRQVNIEVQQRVRALVDLGELPAREGYLLLDRLLAIGDQPMQTDGLNFLEREMEKILHARGIPTKADIDLLIKRLDQLAASIDQLNQEL